MSNPIRGLNPIQGLCASAGFFKDEKFKQKLKMMVKTAKADEAVVTNKDINDLINILSYRVTKY